MIKKEAAITEGQSEIANAEQCMKQMDLEVQPMPQQMRIITQQKVIRYRADLLDIKKRFQDCQDLYLDQKQKEKLMGSRMDNKYVNKIYGQETVLSQQNQMLAEAKKTGFDSMGIAMDVQVQLHKDTETLNRNLLRIKETDNEAGQSDALIQQLERKMKKNKLIIASVLFMVFLAFWIIIYTYF